jgi:hypothetical protein
MDRLKPLPARAWRAPRTAGRHRAQGQTERCGVRESRAEWGMQSAQQGTAGRERRPGPSGLLRAPASASLAWGATTQLIAHRCQVKVLDIELPTAQRAHCSHGRSEGAVVSSSLLAALVPV